eukprot:7447968-Pyramimonas_sp.AAC.1
MATAAANAFPDLASASRCRVFSGAPRSRSRGNGARQGPGVELGCQRPAALPAPQAPPRRSARHGIASDARNPGRRAAR